MTQVSAIATLELPEGDVGVHTVPYPHKEPHPEHRSAAHLLVSDVWQLSG